jgi:hypothetical protein
MTKVEYEALTPEQRRLVLALIDAAHAGDEKAAPVSGQPGTATATEEQCRARAAA